MSNIRLFCKESLSINLTGKLDKSQSHYIGKVMRIKIGDVFSLFNSSGEWEAKILNFKKNIVEFKVTQKLRQKENSKEIWLAFSPIKSNYLNFMIQKATELGVTKFIPIISKRTIVRKVNIERLQKIAQESSEQSNRLLVPSFEKMTNLESFLKSNVNLDIIFGDINTHNNKLDIKKFDKSPVCVLIGPEGDFTEDERQKITKLKNVQCFKIHNNILRTETATISALSILNYIFEL